jgi:hypothetical protein
MVVATYFVSNIALLLIVCGALSAAPWVIRE